MTYDSIPIPQFSFTTVPEREAEKIASMYFNDTYSLGFSVSDLKESIWQRLNFQVGQDDKIIILSYLINKLTEHLCTLPEPKSPQQINIRNRDTLPAYTDILHYLYRLIEEQGVKISDNLFDESTFNESQKLLLSLHNSLEGEKKKHPEKAEALTVVQDEVKKAGGKFLWLGKEDWAKMVIGAFLTAGIKEGIIPILTHILQGIQDLFSNLLPPGNSQPLQ